MSITQLKTTRRDADPLRAELAAAIAAAAEARADVARQRAAIDRTRASVSVAAKNVTAAEEGVGKAREAHAAALAEAASDDTAPPASGVRAARQAVEDAQDEVEAAKAALAQLKSDLALWEGHEREAEISVDSAVSAVLAAQLQPLLDRANVLLGELVPLRKTLFALLTEVSPAGDVLAWEKSRKPLAEIRAAVANLYTRMYHVADEKTDPFASARAVLRENAQAPLPEF